jgi:serine/threonine protein kinase/sugar lactone lactonase YvrE
MTQDKIILGKYRIIEEIGRGGMGVVYKAMDTRIERIVAIKELLINPALIKAAEEIVARFHREAQTAGSLQHPNIVTIHDFGEEDGHHYIAMEFIEGKNLKEYMEEGHKFSDQQLVDILIQICEGMQHAHERSVVHRDIKPDNISITSTGTVKITDFGIARMSSSNPMMKMTQDGTMLGTLGYISPEQLQDSRGVDNRTDIFSLGAMMYEMYTSKLPFDGGNLGATILKIVSEDPVPPSRYNHTMHPKIEQIILKALQKLPDMRYQHAREIADELRSLKSGPAPAATVSCHSCGQPVTANAKFCPHCGAPQNQAAAVPAQEQRQVFVPETSLRRSFMTVSEPRTAASSAQRNQPSFKDRLARLVELASTYQGNAMTPLDRLSFSRTKDTRNEAEAARPAAPPRSSAGAGAIPSTADLLSSLAAEGVMSEQDEKAYRQMIEGAQGGSNAPAPAAPPSRPGTAPLAASPPPPAAAPSTGGGESKTPLRVRFKHKIGQVGAGKGQFYQPRGLAIYQGLVFVADTQNQRIQVFSKIGDWQYLIRSNNEKEFLKAPSSVTVSRSGNIYVVDSAASRIAIFDQSGRFLKSFGTAGKAKGEFSNPYGIAVSKNDEIYIADTENSRIQVLDANGIVTKIFGRPGTRPGEFKTPYAITLDDKDNLYVLDYGIPRIQVLDRHGICRLEFGRRGVREGEFSIPRGLAVDIKGRIYVADTLNHRVQVFTSKGEFIESFGSKGRGPTDFWGPESIAVSEEGEIFVLDKGNSRIQVLACDQF